MGRLRLSTDLLLAAGCALLAVWASRSVFAAYFSPDDLILLERARGLSPPLASLWRILSGRVYFDLVTPIFGVDPRPYMAVNVMLHATCVVLLYAWARRHMGRSGATLAACLFGTSRLFLSVVSQVVGVGEMMALGFTLAACIALSAPSRPARLAGIASFGAALLSKESVALLPLALLLSPALGSTVRERTRRVAPLLGLSAAMMAYVLLGGIRQTAFGGRPYETAFGANLIDAVGLYAAWSVDLRTLIPDYYGATTQVPWGAAIAFLVVAGGLAWFARRRTWAPAVGMAWWLAGLIPVLPLLWQRYLNYLYAPAAGLALAIGGLTELLPAPKPAPPVRARKSARRAIPRPPIRWTALGAWAAVLALVWAHAVRSDSLLHDRVTRRLSYADIPLDPLIRKMELSRRVSTRIRAALAGRHAKVVFYVPKVGDNELFARLLESVLDHGRALKVLCPEVDSAAFVSRWTPEYRDFDLVAGSLDGYVDLLGRGPESHLALAAKLVQFRLPLEAVEHLRQASLAFPRDARLPLARAEIAQRRGNLDEAASGCREVLRIEPVGARADSARAMLRRLDAARPPG